MNMLKNAAVLCRPGSLLGRVVIACAMVICAGCYHYSEPEPGEFADCGAASNGLEVMLKSARPGQSACPGAVRVANQYLDASMSSEGESKVDVQVDGAMWTCRERMNDTTPFTECVMQAEPHDVVRLVS